jgi:hypothetical protein
MARRARKPKPKPKPPKKKPLTRAQKLAKRRDKNPLYNPSVQLSGNNLADAASQLTDLEFKPKESALDTQLKTATTQGTALATRAGDYYRNLASGEADRIAQQQALRQRLSDRLKFIGDAAGSQVDQAQQTADARAKADENLRGAGLSGGGDQKVTDELANRKVQAALTAQGYQGDAEAQSANYEGLQRSMAGTRDLRGAETQGQLLNRLATQQSGIRQQQADLASTKGEAKTKHILDLRQTSFENSATAQGLGLKQEDIAAQAATAAASQDLAGRRQSEVERANRARERRATRTRVSGQKDKAAQRRIAQQNADANTTRANKPAKGPKRAKTPQSVFKGRQAINAARGKFRQFGNWARYARDGRKNNVPDSILRAGFELEHQGFIGPNTARLLRQEFGGGVLAGFPTRPRSVRSSANATASALAGVGRARLR